MPTSDASQGASNCYLFKSRLQEFAQKLGLPRPVYETVKGGPSHEPTFSSTVIVDNVRYDSLSGFHNRKGAEQSAAEVALLELSKSRAMVDSISQPVHETGLCKNLLQEFAQKMNYALPVYHCEKVETLGRGSWFSCTVETGGMKYIGGAAKTKKEAEIKAARTALLAIQAYYSSADSSDDDSGDDDSVLTVVPFKKKEPQENTASLKRKKKQLKKKFKKTKRVKGNRDQNKGDESLTVRVDDNVGPCDINGGSVIKTKEFEVLPSEVTFSECPVDGNVGRSDVDGGSVVKSTDFKVLPAEVTLSNCSVDDNVGPGDINGGSVVKATDYEVSSFEVANSKFDAAGNGCFADVGADLIKYWSGDSDLNINPPNSGAVGCCPGNSDASTVICPGDFQPKSANYGDGLVSSVEDIGEGSLDGLFEDLTP